MTGLEGLVIALGETLAVLVVTLVGMIVTAMIVVVTMNVFLVVASTVCIATLMAAIVAPVARSADLQGCESCRCSASPFCGGVCVWSKT